MEQPLDPPTLTPDHIVLIVTRKEAAYLRLALSRLNTLTLADISSAEAYLKFIRQRGQVPGATPDYGDDIEAVEREVAELKDDAAALDGLRSLIVPLLDAASDEASHV